MTDAIQTGPAPSVPSQSASVLAIQQMASSLNQLIVTTLLVVSILANGFLFVQWRTQLHGRVLVQACAITGRSMLSVGDTESAMQWFDRIENDKGCGN